MASRNHKLLTSVIALLALVNVDAQTTQTLPRLVVNILVDQLRTDYLEAFAPLYGEDGFKRLFKEGRFYTDSQYPFNDVDRASATSCFATGATPYDNGIPSTSWLSRQTVRPVYCDDKPSNLLTTTLSDELELATNRAAIVYSIAPNRDMAMLMAGHIADGAFWIDNMSGAWMSAPYFATHPLWAEQFTKAHSLNTFLRETPWQPLTTTHTQDFQYFFNADNVSLQFTHEFFTDHRFSEFKTSGLINEEVALMVDACLAHTALGADRIPDLLNIGLYAGNFKNAAASASPAELQDIYVRLDQALAHLFASIDQIVGRERTLYVIGSTGYDNSASRDEDFAKYQIPTGTFNIHRASMLLNMYLSALYGQGQYILADFENQIYLDHQLIEQRQLHLSELQQRSGDFIAQMAGVSNTYTAQRLITGAGNPQLEKVRNGWNVNCGGDLLIDVHPGWKIIAEDKTEVSNNGHLYTCYPLFFLGADIKSERITAPVNTSAVAPTLSRHLRIRAPNGSSEAPLPITK